MPVQVNGATSKVSINFIDGFGNKYDELTKTLTRGYPLTLPAAQTHDGYTFIGWNNGEHTFNANASYQAFISETFSATWQFNPTTTPIPIPIPTPLPTPSADATTTSSTPNTSSTSTQNDSKTPSQNPASTPTPNLGVPNENETQSSSIETTTLDSLAHGAGYSCSLGVLNPNNLAICDVVTIYEPTVPATYSYSCADPSYHIEYLNSRTYGQSDETDASANGASQTSANQDANPAPDTNPSKEVSGSNGQNPVAGSAGSGAVANCYKYVGKITTYNCNNAELVGTTCKVQTGTTKTYSCSSGRLSGTNCIISGQGHYTYPCNGSFGGNPLIGFTCTTSTTTRIWVASTSHRVYHPASTSTIVVKVAYCYWDDADSRPVRRCVPAVTQTINTPAWYEDVSDNNGHYDYVTTTSTTYLNPVWVSDPDLVVAATPTTVPTYSYTSANLSESCPVGTVNAPFQQCAYVADAIATTRQTGTTTTTVYSCPTGSTPAPGSTTPYTSATKCQAPSIYTPDQIQTPSKLTNFSVLHPNRNTQNLIINIPVNYSTNLQVDKYEVYENTPDFNDEQHSAGEFRVTSQSQLTVPIYFAGDDVDTSTLEKLMFSPGVQTQIKIRAHNSSGWSEWSEYLWNFTPECTTADKQNGNCWESDYVESVLGENSDGGRNYNDTGTVVQGSSYTNEPGVNQLTTAPCYRNRNIKMVALACDFLRAQWALRGKGTLAETSTKIVKSVSNSIYDYDWRIEKNAPNRQPLELAPPVSGRNPCKNITKDIYNRNGEFKIIQASPCKVMYVDCSGFIDVALKYIYKIDFRENTTAQLKASRSRTLGNFYIKMDSTSDKKSMLNILQPGELIYFKNGVEDSSSFHVAVFVGQFKPTANATPLYLMVGAAGTENGITEQSIWSAPFYTVVGMK